MQGHTQGEQHHKRDLGALWAKVTGVLPRVHGFRFAETMQGSATLNGERHEMVFQVVAEAPSFGDYLRSGRTHMSGHVTIDGLVKEAPLSGELWIKPLSRLIRYEFSFRDGKGRLLQFRGQKNLELLHLMHTLQHLPGDIRDEHGHEVAQAKLRFRKRDLPSFLRSFGLM